jgi:predicted regulator of Ras-like GTPase activity (Roadblock/LC7/MglB family)
MKTVLDAALARLPGALGAAVVGPDGIPVETAVTSADVNMEWAAAEGMDLVRRVATAPGRDAAGDPDEITIAADARLTILRSVGAGYFLCLVAGPDVLSGRARYEAWRTGLQLREVIG